MPIINVKFKDQPVLNLLINDTKIGFLYFELVKKNYYKSKPIFRDPNMYTLDYMKSLIYKANKIFAWNWNIDNYDYKNKPLFHKDLEILLENTEFANIPEEYDNLIHDIHYGLHLYEEGVPPRSGWLQIEWYNDSGFDLDQKFKFQNSMNFGDIKLQNPFVGHGPLQIFQENDFLKISQTCKFHNFVRPGINISTINFEKFTKFTELIEFFKNNDPEFVNRYGEEKIIHYTGYPVIGNVINLDDLRSCLKKDTLELESLSFNE